MPTYRAPVKDMEFVLFDLLGIERYSNLPGFADAPRDVAHAILEEGAKLTEEVLMPLNTVGDIEGCHYDNGAVTAPKGFQDAYKAFVEGGWNGLSADPDFGGQGLPHVIGSAFEEMCCSANMAFAMYPGLTAGAIRAIQHDGSPEQKKTFLPNMISGIWSGTMNLTEPHAGTDLGLLRTRAEPQPDGSYKITGTKIFISAGEHDLTQNIVHLVLARIPGAPEGVKGISLFIVPKFLVNADGSLGARNALACGSIEHKMGIHGNATCVMNYDGAAGWLLGEPHKGLRSMFVMMNAARLGVGIQGLGIGEIAYQNAAIYAKDRLQGRALTGAKQPEKPADPIIVHPDVRRMLLNGAALSEGIRALAYWTAVQVDLSEKETDPAQREAAADLAALLTPVVKSFATDMGFQTAAQSQQCLGGHGYIREWGMEQFVRDARIAQIYEGTNGVQAMDLIGRKLPANGGRAIRAFFGEVQAFLKDQAGNDALKPLAEPLQKALERLQASTMWLVQNAMANPNNGGAAAVDYLNLFALTAVGYMWVKTAVIALERQNGDDADFYKRKLVLARHFITRILPETASLRVKIEAGAENLMALDEAAF